MPTFGSLHITTREEKGLPLSLTELDANFINLASYVAGLDLMDGIMNVLEDSETSGIDISHNADNTALVFSVDLAEIQASSLFPLFKGGIGISASVDDVSNDITYAIDFSEFDSDDIVEGASNLFFKEEHLISTITSSSETSEGVAGDFFLMYDHLSDSLKKISPQNLETLGVTALADLTDTNSVVYNAASLLVANGSSYEEMPMIGDGVLALVAGGVDLKVHTVRNLTNPNTSLFYDDTTKEAWVVNSKVNTDGTYEELPLVGFYTLSGEGTVPDTVASLGSGPGSLCYNPDDEILWIRSS